MWKKALTVLASVALALGAGTAVGLRMDPGLYQTLILPPLSPPAWVFPLAWTILYILMGLAAARIFLSESPDKKRALTWYLAQLAANLVWPWLFFNQQAYLVAFFWLLALLWLVVETVRAFGKIDKTAARLLLPYLLWLCFAAYLNLAVALLNR